MWLITFSQVTTPGGKPITTNTVLNSDCTPAIWLAGAIKSGPKQTQSCCLHYKLKTPKGAFYVKPSNADAPRIDVVFWEAEDESMNSGKGLRTHELDAAIDEAMRHNVRHE